MRVCLLALATAMALPLLASGGAAQTAAAAARKHVETADYSAKGHLVRVDGDGKRISLGVTIKAHWFPNTLRVLLEVNSPAAAREHVLFEMRPDGPNSIRIAHPGDARPALLPFSKWTDGPLGEGFSYEDFLEEPYFWARQQDLGEARFGARLCDKLLSTPGAAEETHFAHVESWLDHASGYPVYVEETMKGSGNVKQFTAFGLRKTEGIWSARQVEVKIKGRTGSTLLIIDRGTAVAHLQLKDFLSSQLTHF